MRSSRGERESGIGASTATSSKASSSKASSTTSEIEPKMKIKKTHKVNHDNNLVYREFEVFANQKLMEAKTHADRTAAEIRRQYSTVAVSFSKAFLEAKLCHLLTFVPAEDRTSLETFIQAASKLGEDNNNNGSPELFCTPVDSRVRSLATLPPKPPKGIVKSDQKLKTGAKFPTVEQMRYRTPINQPDVYQFVGTGSKVVAVTPKVKAPRLLKPGETGLSVFSASGSPIQLPMLPPEFHPSGFPSTPGNNATVISKPVRLKIPDEGNTIDVDVIFRGNPTEKRDAQAFRGFVTDIRGMISTRSTVRCSKRVQEARVAPKSASSKKRKPNWQPTY